jgi:hypothetical protein
MYRLNRIKTLFNCDICNHSLVDPISLPCGNNVCLNHLDNLLPKMSFVCGKCQSNHIVPEEGFKVNKRIQEALDIESGNLEINFASYDDCKTKLEEAREKVAEIKTLEDNSESYIYEYFSSIIRQVDLRREKLKSEIDDYSDDIIQNVGRAQSELIRLSKEINEASMNIERSKIELEKITKQFDTLVIDDQKFENIKQSLDVLNKDLKQTIIDYNGCLIGNNTYEFVSGGQFGSDAFGKLILVFNLIIELIRDV